MSGAERNSTGNLRRAAKKSKRKPRLKKSMNGKILLCEISGYGYSPILKILPVMWEHSQAVENQYAMRKYGLI